MRKVKNQIRRHIHSDEEVKYVEIPSWFRYKHHLMLAPLVLPLIVAGLRKYSTHLIITNKRVLSREGIIGDHSSSVNCNEFTTVKVHQPPMGRIFNYGHIKIHAPVGGHADLNFHYMKNPIKVKKIIEKVMELNTKSDDKQSGEHTH